MTLEELGRRAVACKGWRWMPGMKSRMNGAPSRRVQDDVRTFEEALNVHIYPDLSDPATVGCLLALVRQAYADPAFCIQCVAGYWYEDSDKRELVPRSNETEAEALVAALEAAP